MEVYQDFTELFELLNKYDVRYMIIGSYALAFYGAPRYTDDIDIFIERNEENAQLLLTALDEFGVGTIQVEDLLDPRRVVRFGLPPTQVDILTEIEGLSWSELFEQHETGHYGDIPVSYIGLDDLVKSKRIAGRPRDINDLKALGYSKD